MEVPPFCLHLSKKIFIYWRFHWLLVAFSEYSVFITVSMSGWRNPRGHAGVGQGNVSTVYPLLPGRCTRAGLSLSIKTSPSLRRRRGCSRRGRVYLGLVLQVCTVTSHVTSVTRCSGGTLTVYTDTLQCLRCDLLWGPHCFLWTLEVKIVSEGGHYCHYGQLNHLTWCGVTYWWCAAPCLFLAPSSARCFLLCSFIGVLHSPRP